MPWVRGNAAIRDHEKNGKTLHLFEDAGRGHVRYVEGASCIGHHIEVAPDREDNPRRAIVFELSLESQPDGASSIDLRQPQRRDERRCWTESMGALRGIALSQVPSEATTKQKHERGRKRPQGQIRQLVAEGLEAPDSMVEGDKKIADRTIEIAKRKSAIHHHL